MRRAAGEAYTKAELEACRPGIGRGDEVAVTEEGIGTWSGTVGSVKGSLVSGWWLEVEREDGITFTVHARRVELREAAA